jgi:hypothetical protein
MSIILLMILKVGYLRGLKINKKFLLEITIYFITCFLKAKNKHFTSRFLYQAGTRPGGELKDWFFLLGQD